MWAFRRKFFVFLFFLIIVVSTIVSIYFRFFNKTPTCFDGIQNAQEDGMDCGGLCKEVCLFQATDVNIFWARTFQVVEGVSNTAALIENPNFDYRIEGIVSIKIYDEQNIRLIDFRKKISLGPSEKRLLFIPSINTGKPYPKKTFVNFEQVNSIIKDVVEDNKILLISKRLEKDLNNLTRLNISIKNDDLLSKKNIEITAVLYDGEKEVLNVGKTFLDHMSKEEEKEVFVTWPNFIGSLEEVKEITVFIRLLENEELF